MFSGVGDAVLVELAFAAKLPTRFLPVPFCSISLPLFGSLKEALEKIGSVASSATSTAKSTRSLSLGTLLFFYLMIWFSRDHLSCKYCGSFFQMVCKLAYFSRSPDSISNHQQILTALLVP